MATENQDDTFHVGTKRTLEFSVIGEDGLKLPKAGLIFKWTISKINPNTDAFPKTAKLEKVSPTGITVTEETVLSVDHTYARVTLDTADTVSWSEGDYRQQLSSFNGVEEIMLAEGTLTLLKNMDNA
jgi:hypothetical protein